MTQKNIVIGCLALSLLAGAIVACAVGGIFFLGLTSVADKAEQQGIEFGRQTDQRGCQTEGLQRLRAAIKSNDLLKRREVQLFLYGCFQTCRVATGFCVNAPKEDSFAAVETWAKDQCQQEGFGDDDACVTCFMEVSDACFGKTKHK
jgi:hypothetical protein